MEKENRFLQEIRRVMEERSLSQRRLAALAQVNPSYVSNWMLGQVVPSPEVVLRLAKALGEPNELWLRAAGYDQLADLVSPPGRFVQVTVRGTCLAGTGEALVEEQTTVVPEEFARGADFFVKVQGDSMEPDFPNGALVAVKRSFRVQRGHPVVVLVEGCPVVKLWIDEPSGPVLRSSNPAYPDLPIAEHEIIGIPIRLLVMRDL